MAESEEKQANPTHLAQLPYINRLCFRAGRHRWTLYVHLIEDEELYRSMEENGCVVYSTLSVHIPRLMFKNTRVLPYSEKYILVHELVHVFENELCDLHDSKEFTNVVAELALATADAIGEQLPLNSMLPCATSIRWSDTLDINLPQPLLGENHDR